MERDGADIADALALFDSLPAVTTEEMLGNWHGAGVDTDNPLDGVLEVTGWHGKRYRSTEDAHPLVMEGKKGLFPINPALIPMGAALKFKPFLQRPAVTRVVRAAVPLLKTPKPAARLRMIEYRGVVSGTMVYDALPINDHFRKVDDNTLMGAMDYRYIDRPFIFTLHREG
jgi:hypothetical protein